MSTSRGRDVRRDGDGRGVLYGDYGEPWARETAVVYWSSPNAKAATATVPTATATGKAKAVEKKDEDGVKMELLKTIDNLQAVINMQKKEMKEMRRAHKLEIEMKGQEGGQLFNCFRWMCTDLLCVCSVSESFCLSYCSIE